MADLSALKERIEEMPVSHQVEVLRLLRSHEGGVQTNENSNGTFVNLTALEAVVISKLEAYVQYVHDQQTRLSLVEAEKKRLQQEFFNGDKDKEAE